jgi:hypothetical protein
MNERAKHPVDRQCTEVRFASFFSGEFITAIVVNPPECKRAKRTSVQWRGIIKSYVTIISTINKRGIVVNVKPSNYRVSISKLFNCIPELNKTTRKKQIHTKDQIIFGIKFYILGYHKNLVFGMDFNML